MAENNVQLLATTEVDETKEEAGTLLSQQVVNDALNKAAARPSASMIPAAQVSEEDARKAEILRKSVELKFEAWACELPEEQAKALREVYRELNNPPRYSCNVLASADGTICAYEVTVGADTWHKQRLSVSELILELSKFAQVAKTRAVIEDLRVRFGRLGIEIKEEQMQQISLHRNGISLYKDRELASAYTRIWLKQTLAYHEAMERLETILAEYGLLVDFAEDRGSFSVIGENGFVWPSNGPKKYLVEPGVLDQLEQACAMASRHDKSSSIPSILKDGQTA